MKPVYIDAAYVSGAISRLPAQCFHLMNGPAKAVSRSSMPALIIGASPVVIIANRRAAIFGIWRKVYTSTLYGSIYQTSPTVSPESVAGVPVDAVPVETISSKLKASARKRLQSLAYRLNPFN